MLVNGYEIMDEPATEEFHIFFRVEQFFEQEAVALWLGSPEDDEERLTQDEFEHLCHWFHKADFGAEESEYVRYLRDEIIRERSEYR